MVAERYLRFDVKRPPKGRPLLWPVYVWQVLYPTKRTLKINLFQQAILGLARARCQDTSEMAKLLGLDKDLVTFIIATQLIPRGWMTGMGTLTPEGDEILEETQEHNEEVHMGYAFQDAISGNWIPRFSDELPEIEPKKVDTNGYPIFLRNLDSGKEDRPFLLGHANEGRFDISALFEAFERYRTDYDYAMQLDDTDNVPNQLRFESLSSIENKCQRMWVWTWVFPDEANSQPWLVTDPFGLQRAAGWLRKPLEEILPKNDGLAKYIADSFGEVRPNEMSATEWLRTIENKIDLELLADYTWARKVPNIESYLASVLRRSSLLQDQEKNWQEDVTSLLIETHNLAESVLQWLLRVYPPEIRRLPHWKDQRDWKDGEAVYYLKFFDLPCLTEDVIKRLAEQRLDQVRSAAKRGGSSLKALLFASLLATVDQSRHPFHSLSDDQLQLSQLLDMADARNKKAGHSGAERINKDEALKYAEFVLSWTKNFKEWY